ncbi:hypothetical protein E2C01_044623 [Portunus trituberculatus]|uniref:PI-PLC Y-box domain-containing protein n=1 Tax=Portunus trituberculatus TaxID=210409 RepID=A0A5B7FZU6_PORTR|nr:hypothetical protein [Portunus trituberculatus]
MSMFTCTHLACITATACLCHSTFGDNLATTPVFNIWPRSHASDTSCYGTALPHSDWPSPGLLHWAPTAQLAPATQTTMDTQMQMPHAITGVHGTCSYLTPPTHGTCSSLYTALKGVQGTFEAEIGHCLGRV